MLIWIQWKTLQNKKYESCHLQSFYILILFSPFTNVFLPVSLHLLGLPSYVTCVLLFTSMWVAPGYLIISDHLLLVFAKLLCVSNDIIS